MKIFSFLAIIAAVSTATTIVIEKTQFFNEPIALISDAHAGWADKLKKKLKKKIEKQNAKKADKKSQSKSAERTPATIPAAKLSCDVKRRAGICYSFTGDNHLKEKYKGNKFACQLLGGKLAGGENKGKPECGKLKAVGMCHIDAGTPDAYTLVYYKGTYRGKKKRLKIDKDFAKKDCADPNSGIHSKKAGTFAGL